MIGYVIGDSDMVTGFRLVGVEGAEVTSSEEAKQALNKALTQTDIAIIVISAHICGVSSAAGTNHQNPPRTGYPTNRGASRQ